MLFDLQGTAMLVPVLTAPSLLSLLTEGLCSLLACGLVSWWLLARR